MNRRQLAARLYHLAEREWPWRVGLGTVFWRLGDRLDGVPPTWRRPDWWKTQV